MMMDLTRGAFLVAVWVLLWDRFSVANLVTGIVVVTAILLLFPTRRRDGATFTFRPVPALALAWFVVRRALSSNVFIVRSVVRPGRHVHAGVVTVPLHCPSEGLLAFVANVIALTPGTATVEVLASPPALVLHVLDVSDPDAVSREVHELESLTVRTFGTTDMVEALAVPCARPTAELDVPTEVPG